MAVKQDTYVYCLCLLQFAGWLEESKLQAASLSKQFYC